MMPGDSEGARGENELVLAEFGLDDLLQALRHGTACCAVQIASEGSTTRRTAKKRQPQILVGGEFQADFENRHSHLGKATAFPKRGNFLDAVIGWPYWEFCTVALNSFRRHRLGGARYQIQHRHAVLEIPLACRDRAAVTRDPRHLAYRLRRIRQFLENKQRERGVERVFREWERVRR